jgi:2-polyprenyl-6-methoxyphenol hydroxylase-like FAD-dependent oxidoreductase
VSGRVAIIGDAAHAQLPWTGLGISAAALDAQCLAVNLAAVRDEPGCDVAAALIKYDTERKPHDYAVQKAARASDGGQGPQAYRTGVRTLPVLPLILRYGVQDALVRDCGGSVRDSNECRTEEGDKTVFRFKMGCCFSCLLIISGIVWACVAAR